MSEDNEAILQAIQAGFAHTERQFTDLIASNSRLENKVDNIGSRLANLEAELMVKPDRKPGSATGLIWISDDFDEPPEEFKEYME